MVGFMATARILGRFTYSLADLAGMDTTTLTPVLLDSTIETISTVRSRRKPERQWNQKDIANAGKAVGKEYGIEGLDDWDAVTLGDGGEWAAVDLDFAMTVDRHLPSQPWKPGAHRVVAKQLGCSVRRCSEAIQFLIEQGVRYRQEDGVVYDVEGNVVDYDRERADDGAPSRRSV